MVKAVVGIEAVEEDEVRPHPHHHQDPCLGGHCPQSSGDLGEAWVEKEEGEGRWRFLQVKGEGFLLKYQDFYCFYFTIYS